MNTLSEPGALSEEGYIPLCVPEIRGNEWKYIKECLDTGWVSSVGSFVDRFESDLSEYVETQYGVATVNGTAALHVALLVAGVEPDDEVLVSTLSFIAPANAIRYAGGWPVFIDSEPDHWQMDPQKVIDFLKQECSWKKGELRNNTTGRRIKAILPVHILGHPVDMDPIVEIARKYEIAVIEDATESLGARYKDRMVGTLGDIGCFSFNGNKIITTGGGGMVVTDNEAWADKARYLTTQAKDDPVEYVHKNIGYNYRLTNIQAAMGCAQLEKLDEYIASKRSIADTYSREFENSAGICIMSEAAWASSIFWMYTILVDEKEYGLSSRQLLQNLDKHGIQARPLWQPLHLSQIYLGSQITRCAVAERLNTEALSLPCSVGLNHADQQRVVDIVRSHTRN